MFAFLVNLLRDGNAVNLLHFAREFPPSIAGIRIPVSQILEARTRLSIVTETVEKGKGMTNSSQVFMRKQRENFACTGIMGAAVNCASEIAPGPRTYRGPRGPSGVMAISRPSSTNSTSSRKARDPRLELEPRTAPIPN